MRRVCGFRFCRQKLSKCDNDGCEYLLCKNEDCIRSVEHQQSEEGSFECQICQKTWCFFHADTCSRCKISFCKTCAEDELVECDFCRENGYEVTACRKCRETECLTFKVISGKYWCGSNSCQAGEDEDEDGGEAEATESPSKRQNCVRD